MPQINFISLVTWFGNIIDIAGVVIMVLGVFSASVWFFVFVKREGMASAYSQYRQTIGRVILLGLEFLVAGDIIKTVALSPTLVNIGILGGIVLIRTFLSFTLQLEVEGRWPWQSVKVD